MYQVETCNQKSCEFCTIEKAIREQNGIKSCPICGINCAESIYLTHEENPHRSIDRFDFHSVIRTSVYLQAVQKYDLLNEEDHRLLEYLENIPGVYALYDSDDFCWYVGLSTSLYDRLRKHLKGDKTTQARGLYLYFRKVEVFQVNPSDKSHLALLEQMVITLRKPYHNLTSNGIQSITKGELENKLQERRERSRKNWSNEERIKLDDLWFKEKKRNWRENIGND